MAEKRWGASRHLRSQVTTITIILLRFTRITLRLSMQLEIMSRSYSLDISFATYSRSEKTTLGTSSTSRHLKNTQALCIMEITQTDQMMILPRIQNSRLLRITGKCSKQRTISMFCSLFWCGEASSYCPAISTTTNVISVLNSVVWMWIST
ncbi:hypothetical protein CLUG_03409 [Clavispora lusitaniae ATCC 42720]|uniref:Uncharacterized protein n=1 Tax=Clavispora lusitaniae (strain ATCC 42720) TaxID=306902 RepID=C4Y5H5_CLAL4|nr:uncharacterized protein CLUG_03409 [Clavispora lusitaniae ATCC 42720]EEQ39281.1 hypothetical protein CLUG_03409 [Clavispora lusitaniae ATCC 42720]